MHPTTLRAEVKARELFAQLKNTRPLIEEGFSPVDSYLIATHEALSVQEQADALEISYKTILRYRQSLRQRNLIRNEERIGCPPISAQERKTIQKLYMERVSIRSIALMCDIPLSRVRIVVEAEDIPQRDKLFTLTDIGRMFDSESLASIALSRGWLPYQKPDTRKKTTQRKIHHQFTVANLVEFVQIRNAWMLYHTSQITNPDIRRAAELARIAYPGRWVSFKEIEHFYDIAHGTMSYYVRKGMFTSYEVIQYQGGKLVWLRDDEPMPELRGYS